MLPGLVLFFFAFTLSRQPRRRPSPQAPVHKAKTKSFFPPLETRAANSIELDYCQNFPVTLLDEVQVVLKVASSEASETKAHLATVSSCIKNLLIVGDRDESFGERHVIDILAELPKSYETNNLDFQAYVEQKKAHIEGETVRESQRSFKVDRFKYLPMVDKAYISNPKAKWFVFLESDVYFFWDTLFRLLSQLDASEPHYLGAPHKGSDGRFFAYGGAGIVLSQGLMKQLIPAKPAGSTEFPRENRLSLRFEDWVKEEQRGDAVLAYAILNATGHKLEALYPTFASEKLKDVTTTKERWCVPMLSLHQLKPEQMERLWKWERTRPYNIVGELDISCYAIVDVPRNLSPTPPSSLIPTPSSLKVPPAIGGTISRQPQSRTIAPPTVMLVPAVMNAEPITIACSGRIRKLSAVTQITSSSVMPLTGRMAVRASSSVAGILGSCGPWVLESRGRMGRDNFMKDVSKPLG